MNNHSIIVIKNKNNEYLQYYDERWNSFLFMNCKLDDNFNENTIIDYVSEKLNIEKENISCFYIGDKVHKKYSVSALKEKEYHHYFYKVDIDINQNDFQIGDIKYCWYSYEKLKNDKRIMEVNSDIVSFIKEFNL